MDYLQEQRTPQDWSALLLMVCILVSYWSGMTEIVSNYINYSCQWPMATLSTYSPPTVCLLSNYCSRMRQQINITGSWTTLWTSAGVHTSLWPSHQHVDMARAFYSSTAVLRLMPAPSFHAPSMTGMHLKRTPCSHHPSMPSRHQWKPCARGCTSCF